MSKPNVVIFCGRILPPSETFIRAQGEGLKNFEPYYVGSRFVKGLSLPSERTLVVNEGGSFGAFQEVLFKVTGISPKVRKKVKQLNPVLLHAHFGVCGALALPLVQSLNLPMIVTFHGLDATMKDEYARKNSISTRVYLKRRELLKQQANLFITVSKFLKAELVQQGFPSEKILVHYIGVDTELFQPQPITNREPIVLFVGRLVEKKGCEYLIKAMERVQAENPEIALLVIGDGPLRNSLENLAKSLLKNYRFLGSQPPEVVKHWMQIAKIFCVPSIRAESGDCESFGIVFAEAQAMGLPVVSFASGGIPEVVAHQETGFLAPERDVQTLAEYVLQLFNDSVLWQSFSQNGRQRVENMFNLHKQTQILEEKYQMLLNNQM
ncbi:MULTISPECIES: glycosyltransferase [Nostocales]|uniref:glycosyltransferase n=1 Tax=Nostocales TaxID=1161 RepID=UPI001682D7B0|nr:MULTISPECIES: glycosyltransferase [Nostocales]MBD2298352.1 glycosyltransferase [Nostoc sp. FACHB-190]MBD2488694.1 glycosyltransferase [Aulosira sp. FACHB-615]